jgi:hypothetical protein
VHQQLRLQHRQPHGGSGPSSRRMGHGEQARFPVIDGN